MICGQSPNVVAVTITWAPLVFRSRLTRSGTWFGRRTKLSCPHDLASEAL